MSVTLTSPNVFMKKQMNFPIKREFEDYTDKKDDNDASFSDGNSEASDVENNPNDEANSALDYTENTLSQPMADFIKKEFLPEFDFTNPFRNQNLAFKDGFQNTRSPFLLPSQLYKSFLATLGKRRRNITDCYSLYSRNMLFSNTLGLETDLPDDENADRITNSPDEKAGASSAFVWSGGGVTGGGGQEQPAPQPAAVPTGTSGGGGAQGLVHWMSVMAEHMGGGHHDSHYALPPWNNGSVDSRQNLFSDSERIITTFLYNFDKEIRVATEWDHYTDILRALDTIVPTPAAPANVCKFCGQPYY
ncbi:unnamed protein product [Danaus chrysippus]|uniref:(African queen) hypothetical protein n=1 Tax=Danaus chrysippus TaxID=151541 RepID=A0A8J2QU44_9NEOP|nr:unnamed protein product [Danaus chrysippus]